MVLKAQKSVSLDQIPRYGDQNCLKGKKYCKAVTKCTSTLTTKTASRARRDGTWLLIHVEARTAEGPARTECCNTDYDAFHYFRLLSMQPSSTGRQGAWSWTLTLGDNGVHLCLSRQSRCRTSGSGTPEGFSDGIEDCASSFSTLP